MDSDPGVESAFIDNSRNGARENREHHSWRIADDTYRRIRGSD